MRLSFSLAVYALAVNNGLAKTQHIRGNNGADVESDATSHVSRKAHRKSADLIEINDPQSTNNHNRYSVTPADADQELRSIFAEDVDHWDRMLQVESFVPTKAPTSSPEASPVAAPTESPERPPAAAPVEDIPPTEAPDRETSFPSYFPSVGVTEEPVADPTDAPVTEAPAVAGETPVPSYFPSVSVTDVPTPGITITLSPIELAPVATVPPAPTAATPRPTTLPATIWDILLLKSQEFSILIAASEAVGFNEVLQTDEVRTLFAPNNTAFSNLQPADLLDKYFDFELWTDEYISRLLFCHDIAGSIIFSFQFQNGTRVLPCLDFVDPAFTITTPPLQISKPTMPVPANIAEGDLLAQNGVVHIIDQVMTTSYLRLNLPQGLAGFGGFSILLELLELTGLDEVLSGSGPFTVFAPPDEVFERYGDDVLDMLKDDPDTLTNLLLNHVVGDVIIPCCEFDETTYETVAGNTIVLNNIDETEPRNFTVNGIPTIPILTNGLTSNGKINAISDILFPSDAPETPVGSPTDAPAASPSVVPVESAATTWDIIKSRPEEFATFIVAAEAVGFDSILQEETERTVFVPNEAGFASVIPPDLLAKYFEFDTWSREYLEVLLLCHELTGTVVLSTDLTNGTEVVLCQDLIDPVAVITLPPPQLSKETMSVPANIVEVDLVADNGVVHVIDQVITNSFLRYNLVDAGLIAGGYSILLELIELTGLLDIATGPGPFTIFAPSDELFESYGQEFIDGLKADINGTRTILLNHIVPGVIIPCCLEESTVFFSAAEEPLMLDNYNPNNPSEYTVNGIPTIPSRTNLLTSNAKVNTISDFLLPAAPVPTDSPASGEADEPTVAPAFFPTFVPTSDDTTVPPGTVAPSPSSPLPPDTVWDIVMSNPEEFATFIAAAEFVGFDQFLQESSEITLFVPNEQAFMNLLPPDLLVKYFDSNAWTSEYIVWLLLCHDIEGAAILSSGLTNGAEFATCLDVLDPEFVFSSPPPQIGKETMPVPATIVGPDQESLNGVVHVVDQVLTTSFLRYNLPEAMEALDTFSILLELIVLTDLLEFAEGDGPFTLFAPVDSVFQSYGQDFIDNLKMDVEGTRALLLNHVVPDQIVPCCLGEATTFTSAAGFPLTLDGFSSGSDRVFSVNGVASVEEIANFLTSNAKLNAIQDFLLPPSTGK